MHKLPSKSPMQSYNVAPKNSGFNWLNHRWQVVLVCCVPLLLILILYNQFNYILPAGEDVRLYYDYAERMRIGQLPYRDFQVEYPPLALLLVFFPDLLLSWFGSTSPDSYDIAFHFECFIPTIGTILMVAALWFQTDSFSQPKWRLGMFSVGGVILSLFLYQRLDITATFLTISAIWFMQLKKSSWAGIALGLGTLVKLYPAILLPLFLIYCWKSLHSRREIYQLITGFGFTCLAIVLPTALVVTPEKFLTFLAYHAQRGVESESLFASLIMLGRWTGLTTVGMSHDHGSFNLVSDWALPLASFSSFLILIGLVAIYWLAWRNTDATAKVEVNWLVDTAAITILWFIIANKVLSPQYMLWLLPFIPFWKGFKLSLFVLVMVLTLIPFPLFLDRLYAVETSVYVILILRNLLLVAIFVQLLSLLWNSKNKLGEEMVKVTS